MTIFLSEGDVGALLDMGEVVDTVEEVFRRVGLGEGVNSPRTRSYGPGSVLNVMHASLSYLGRAGLKCYVSTPRGTKFLVVLFDTRDATALAVMGADMLGRYRTGAASAVATKHLYRKPSARVAIFGTGRQALTQVLALREVISLEEVNVWSPNGAHRKEFVKLLDGQGVRATEAGSPREASSKAEVGSTITSASVPFLNAQDVALFAHLNICGGNQRSRSEISSDAVGSFESVYVDDLSQAKIEYGDLTGAVSQGALSWEDVHELAEVVAGKSTPKGRTLFKSGGVATMDVAVASMIFDRATESGAGSRSSFDF